MEYHNSHIKSVDRIVNVIGYSLIGFFAYQLYTFIQTLNVMMDKL